MCSIYRKRRISGRKLSRTVKGLRFSLQANKLAHHRFMDADSHRRCRGQRYRPVWFTAIAVARGQHFLPPVHQGPFPQGDAKGKRGPVCRHIGMPAPIVEGDMISIFQSCKQSVLCPTDRPYLYLQRLFTLRTSLKRESRTEAVSASACKVCRNVRDTWRIVFQERGSFLARSVLQRAASFTGSSSAWPLDAGRPHAQFSELFLIYTPFLIQLLSPFLLFKSMLMIPNVQFTLQHRPTSRLRERTAMWHLPLVIF